MFSLFKRVYGCLSKRERKKLFLLQVLVLLSSVMELISIFLIAPYVSLLTKPETANLYLEKFIFLPDSPDLALLYIGLCIFSFLMVSTSLSMLSTWRLSMFGAKVGVGFGDRLFSYYLNKGWDFHISTSSSYLVKQIANEAIRVTANVIQPMLIATSKIIIVFFMLLAVTIYNPLASIYIFLIFLVVYSILFKVVKKRLLKNGKELPVLYAKRFSIMSNSFGGMRDIIILNASKIFSEKFSKVGSEVAQRQGVNSALNQTPKYFIEFILFSGMVMLTAFVSYRGLNDSNDIVASLSFYILVCLKILPAFQTIYASSSSIRGNLGAFEAIENDLRNSKDSDVYSVASNSRLEEKSKDTKIIELENGWYRYPESHDHSLKDVNIAIDKKAFIGLVGLSGAGKSTLLDVLSGMTFLSKGSMYFNGAPLNSSNVKSFRSKIGFVSQNTFLIEGSVAENIAFGIKSVGIDKKRIMKVIEQAFLSEFIATLPEGIDTQVGERGVRFSGGQIQRIGIARALYVDPEIVFFDEATSALDLVTEKLIMDTVEKFIGKKTIIIIAHKVNTLKGSDCIYVLKSGEITSKTTYEKLISNESLIQ